MEPVVEFFTRQSTDMSSKVFPVTLKMFVAQWCRLKIHFSYFIEHKFTCTMIRLIHFKDQNKFRDRLAFEKI